MLLLLPGFQETVVGDLSYFRGAWRVAFIDNNLLLSVIARMLGNRKPVYMG